MLIDRVHELDELDDDVDLDRLADILAALSDAETILHFTDHYGWSLGATIDFLQHLLMQQFKAIL